MHLRYFARTDDTALGQAAAAYCDALVATELPVRLVSTRVAELQVDRRGRLLSCWDRHRQLLITPMDSGFVNVVCGEPTDWLRFHTPSVLNVLLLTEQGLSPAVPQPVLMEAAALYPLIYVPSIELAEVMFRVTGITPNVADPGSPRAGDNIRATLAAHGILF